MGKFHVASILQNQVDYTSGANQEPHVEKKDLMIKHNP